MIRSMADGWKKDSLANRLRQRRLSLLQDLTYGLHAPVTLLDVGGQEEFWNSLDVQTLPELHITFLNLFPVKSTLPHSVSVVGDARRLHMFADREFDVVFSSSVIEHVGSLRDQKAMATECTRVGKRYYIQTPSRSFPIEPHFLLPGFQHLPTAFRAMLHSRFDLGWWKRARTYYEAYEEVESIRLLTKKELQYLFPDARIHEERLYGFVKSFVALSHSGGPGA